MRSLLLFVALIACALVAGREWSKWNAAHERYERALALWEFGHIRSSDVVSAAEALYNDEAQTIWMRRSTARKRHAERLNKLADRVEGFTRTTLFGSPEALEEQRKIAEQLRARVAEPSAPPNPHVID
jgi:hypothetical protein